MADEHEQIYVYNDETGGTAQVVRGALEHMAEKGWYEVDPPDPAEEAAAELEGLKKDQLVAQAEARGLDSSGTKDDLIDRLSTS